MTIEEIRKNAPKGATHYLIQNSDVKYYKNDNGFMVYDEKWCRLAFIGKHIANIELAYLAMILKPL